MSATRLEAPRRRAVARWRRLQESPRPVIYVGVGSCGLAAGAGELLDGVGAYLEEHRLDAEIVKVGCIGPCYLEPLLDVQLPGRPRLSYANMTPALAAKTLDALLAGEVPKRHLVGHLGDGGYAGDQTEGAADGVPRFADHPMLARQMRIVLRNCGIIDPEDVDHYLARGGYAAIERCLDMTPAGRRRSGQAAPACADAAARASRPGRNGPSAGRRRATSATSSATPTRAIPAPS